MATIIDLTVDDTAEAAAVPGLPRHEDDRLVAAAAQVRAALPTTKPGAARRACRPYLVDNGLTEADVARLAIAAMRGRAWAANRAPRLPDGGILPPPPWREAYHEDHHMLRQPLYEAWGPPAPARRTPRR